MNYDFVLRDIPPGLGKHLTVLAEMLSYASGRGNTPLLALSLCDCLDTLDGLLRASALTLHGAARERGQIETLFVRQVNDLRATLQQWREGNDGNPDYEIWREKTAALATLGDLLYWPLDPAEQSGPRPTSRQKVLALNLLLDNAVKSLTGTAIVYPELSPALAQARDLRDALLKLVLDPGFSPDTEEDDAEDDWDDEEDLDEWLVHAGEDE